ncbi:MAG: ABC transporter ATP-binding protein [Actinomycetia bacterium]|nr:ABC transporter ATP-binding protein [Actinomycetes bacterium]
MAVLEMRDVSLTYHPEEGPVPAVRGVNLSVAAGEVIGVAGESGCGKSTLISTVLRLYPKNATVEGEVLVDGENVFDMKWNRMRAVRWGEAAVVFQGALHSLNPIQRIGKQLIEPILVHDKGATEASALKRVRELLEQVGLPLRHADAYPHQLSGGQKQRIMIALALTCDPKVLLCDEPTTALDVMVQAQILDLLKGIARDRQMGVLIISHDLSVLSTNCDRIAIMYAGRVVEQGGATELFQHPAHPYTRALMGAFPTIGDTESRYSPSGLPGDPPFPGDLPSGCAFHPRCPIATEECKSVNVVLEQIGPGREAACIHVEKGVSAS